LPEGAVDFSYDDKDRLSEVSGPGYRYKYDYGVAFVGGNSPLVMEINLENGQWGQHIYDTNGLPVRYYDSFLWEKGYQYNFTSGTGTPIGFTPTKVWYAKKGLGTTYNTEYKHDPMGRLRNKLNTFLGTEEWYTYDSKGLLQQLLYRQYPNMSGSFPTVTLDLQRDLSGLITGLTGAKQLSASFNPDLEITAVQHTFPTTFTEAYTYDPRGNRLASLANTFSYNDLNQLLESATHSYTYDADGNLIQERNKASGELKKYFYNAENRLTGYEHYANEFTSVNQIAQYTYDLYGRRIQKTVNGIVTNFLWDEDNISLELNENHQPIRRYVYGVGMDNVEGHFEYSEATSNPFATDKKGWYTYIKDQVGTIYKTFSHGTSQVVNSRAYDTFGNLISQSGTSKSPLGFQSKYLDPESGLYYFYHRYYSPSLGRFTTEDPIGIDGGLNFFNFVTNNPINLTDPSGLWFGIDDILEGPFFWADEAIVIGTVGLAALLGSKAAASTLDTLLDELFDKPLEMSKTRSKEETWVTEKAKADSRRTGKDICDILDEMLKQSKCEKDNKLTQDIIKAQKFLGCRNKQKRSSR